MLFSTKSSIRKLGEIKTKKTLIHFRSVIPNTEEVPLLKVKNQICCVGTKNLSSSNLSSFALKMFGLETSTLNLTLTLATFLHFCSCQSLYLNPA